ncbi:Gfo/Idh/MocA family oxidoreductase [uncultured Sulfitobacter sp.]|uniref:Gfo/Idh/MocA family protein n=1 Tax=uncultured Sulfitobacter sp. TaxID=191468 RepID=UPI0030DB0A3C|tara:strand:+ start:155188 stop:156150 length:963 start_codon:yes stop_codon:yes gene_type:complete
MKTLNWGIIGASKFAYEQMGPAIHAAQGARLAGLATSSPQKAEPFKAFAPDIKVYSDYSALLDDPGIDAVYIPLPNHLHVEWTVKALEAGKHVLCEKPMTMQATQFDELIAARDASGLLAAEAFMIVHHPQMIRARDIIASGAIGRVRHIGATFSFYNGDLDDIRNKPQAGGGGLPDIGIYTFGSVRFLTGQEPLSIPYAKIDYENGVDVFAQVAATFDGFDYSATVSMRMFPRQEIVVHGEKGVLRLSCPFNPTVHSQAELHLETENNMITTERFPGTNHYILQVEAFGRTVTTGEAYLCPLEFSKGTQAMIDMAYAAR